MSAHIWTCLLAPWLISVSANGQQSSVEPPQEDLCETKSVSAPLASSVLLPCIFSTSGLSWVIWAHVDDKNLLHVVKLTSNSRVQFLDPRQGRVKAFPNQASVGNFSISVDELKTSDLGSYSCRTEKDCIEVKLQEAKGEQFDEDLCEANSVRAPLGSSVLLPCIFSTHGDNWVNWTHLNRGVLVRVSSNGRVQFPDPRQGRVKAFSNQASVGNFSISMDELKDSDLGSYHCRRRDRCFLVDLLEDKNALDGYAWRLIYICSGAAALILLCVGGYFCWIRHAGASVPPQEEVGEHEMGVDNISTVYENDDQYLASSNPTINQSDPAGDPQHHQDQAQPGQSNAGIYPNLDTFKFERAESHRRRQRFHIELISRFRQASRNRHFYVNQREINKQQAMAAQAEKDKKSCDYQNPIYNRSSDQGNQM